MRKTISALASVAFIAGTMLTGCQSSAEDTVFAEKNMQTEKEIILAAKQDLYQAHQDSIADIRFRMVFEERIISNEKTIADYKAWIAEEIKENRAAHYNRLALLEQKNDDLKKKLSDYYKYGKDPFGSFKSEFSHEMEELAQSLKDFKLVI